MSNGTEPQNINTGEHWGRKRVVINHLSTDLDGFYPVKRVQGESLSIYADIFADGHDVIDARLQVMPPSDDDWQEIPMTPMGNDRWLGQYQLTDMGFYAYTIIAWVDPFESWKQYFAKKYEASQDVAAELTAGARIIRDTAELADQTDAAKLLKYAQSLEDTRSLEQAASHVRDQGLAELMSANADRHLATRYEPTLYVWVDRPRARFSAWYEVFPRSCSPQAGKHGTFDDLIEHLPYIADMGFDVVYLPPIHPIGRTNRKGKNNTTQAGPDDVGSPWGIGSEEGGHKAVHPELGTIDDFRQLVERAKDYGMETALDIALQCSPDHPYLKQHPQWFSQRPDGTLRFAENPPKKYEDIYPIDFETADWWNLWQEIKSVFEFWIDQGVKIFRVDNPHTKPFAFWHWLISNLQGRHPDVIFLAEAFTRPKVMHHLAKIGFTQSYTYFTWRNTPEEMRQYLIELTQSKAVEYFRPNFWPNTPDILHEYLQQGGRPAFIVRLVLAATLSSNYGIYGPAFELCVNTPKEQGSEEYLNSEKYEIKDWDYDDEQTLRPVIKQINAVRRSHPALQSTANVSFHESENPQFLCYSKRDEANDDTLLVIVNFDTHNVQSGWTDLDLSALALKDGPFQVIDLLDGQQYQWQGRYNFVKLNPAQSPVHIFEVRQTDEAAVYENQQ